jgi:hypothetical protein
MTAPDTRAVQPLPRGVLASILVGATAAACGWALCTLLPSLTTSSARLDQLAAAAVGASTAAAVLAAREYRQRRSGLLGAACGLLLGGVGALAGASLLAFGHAAVAPRLFLLERMLAWLLACVGTTIVARSFAPNGRRHGMLASGVIAAVGGMTAGAIFTLPGATEAWQGIAMLWFGGSVGLAIAGPELWDCYGVLALLPSRGQAWNPLLMREWPVQDGFSIGVGEARIACQQGRIALYPPAGGVSADGRMVRRPRFIANSTIITVGHQRYHVQLLRTP